MLNEVWTFVCGVVWTWVVFVTGAAVTLATTVYERWKKREIPRRWLIIIVASALLVSCFQAWRGQYRVVLAKSLAVEGLERDKKT